MDDNGYPALFYAADRAAGEAQRSLVRLHLTSTSLLVVGAVLSMWSDLPEPVKILGALLYFASLLTFVIGQHKQYRAIWYQSRALAESVKTSSWRLVTGAEPFDHATEEQNLEAFRELLRELLDANKGIGEHLSGDWSKEDQVTAPILDQLRAEFDARRSTYLEERIDRQRQWYAAKASVNRRGSKRCFWVLCLVYGIAIVLQLVKVNASEAQDFLLPIDAVAVVASGLIGWMQLRRYDELASAYGLTAHELGIIRSRFEAVADATDLARFVADSENAISREHTQWAARRDH